MRTYVTPPRATNTIAAQQLRKAEGMQENSLECFLYHSQLAPGADTTCIAAIIKAARTFNWSAGITGMLVFDGERFFQYVEGPPEQLALLVESISRDERHINFTPLFPQARIDQRRFAKWSMAYVIVEDTEPLGTISELQGPGALEKLQELLPLLDAQ
ncbi:MULTISPECIES: BLUF domain-containing protein [Delftia]|nr:BLUF domain-containing protein [Delftia acidovorans]